ncbi:bifunctional UDP-N-acetylglucosamine diphosphorylase/glucosamine-1-phosphate N-acetyltransferase GlmU [Frigidibacter sp. ROC022]|uniref:bifunctional UDP-N-acetylglucosamine diphosphorylase/glucosamine-1-phosphate N-acetyltransferase GlmU n=1 Tax=Frigidibacter sp. ROC022 TaxID=2971796 RepID=UPI00215B47C0|nr:bifunctional UDP-N-acetylglucosamine diphosphorylase/glucosamine-1-phosphate N-acetyltransferase GlmU [Frigidibacter sp. ROC022]MCR8725484.1 bifunctional UDP-N-acetylglucosamine diphosphorylase/glucosamine-1-phosphate N-acetyltransferase GlmU [Frigidibacter sp. ROC022]
MSLALIVLAAGQGSRMNSDLPKVLHPLGGVPLFVHALAAGQALQPEHTVLVTGHGAEAVEDAALRIDPDIVLVRQDEQLGTGHAVLQARAALAGFEGDVVVLYADTPFVTPETLDRMVAARTQSDVVVLGFEAPDSARYGRLMMDGERLERIVEWKDATDEERLVTFCNSGMKMAKASVMFDLLSEVGNQNAAGEYYLTDIVGIANARGLACTAVACDEAEVLGINTRAELARAEGLFQARARAAAIENGVTLISPETVHFARDTVIGRDAVIDPFVVFGPAVTVESGAHIRSFSHLENAHVGAGAVIGPYARLRPGAEVGDKAHVGNFVEIKNATLGTGAKVNHLSYIGDAAVGEATNIGAGTITCNYDGVFKHRTTIGARAFVGSNTMFVAPVTMGDEAMTATGTVVTQDIAPGDMAIGRARQEAKPGLARRLMDRLKAARKAREEG